MRENHESTFIYLILLSYNCYKNVGKEKMWELWMNKWGKMWKRNNEMEEFCEKLGLKR